MHTCIVVEIFLSHVLREEILWNRRAIFVWFCYRQQMPSPNLSFESVILGWYPHRKFFRTNPKNLKKGWLQGRSGEILARGENHVKNIRTWGENYAGPLTIPFFTLKFYSIRWDENLGPDGDPLSQSPKRQTYLIYFLKSPCTDLSGSSLACHIDMLIQLTGCPSRDWTDLQIY